VIKAPGPARYTAALLQNPGAETEVTLATTRIAAVGAGHAIRKATRWATQWLKVHGIDLATLHVTRNGREIKTLQVELSDNTPD
jgi:hypothetical protein